MSATAALSSVTTDTRPRRRESPSTVRLVGSRSGTAGPLLRAALRLSTCAPATSTRFWPSTRAPESAAWRESRRTTTVAPTTTAAGSRSMRPPDRNIGSQSTVRMATRATSRLRGAGLHSPRKFHVSPSVVGLAVDGAMLTTVGEWGGTPHSRSAISGWAAVLFGSSCRPLSAANGATYDRRL